MSIPTPSQVFPSKIQVLNLPIRSTKNGGKWHMSRIPIDGSCPTRPEIDKSMKNLSETVRDLISARFQSMWDRAIKGDLTFGATEDVGEIHTCPPVLFEMRVNHNPNARKEQQRLLYRLYFAEPVALPGVMLALKFGRKPGDGDPTGVQQGHIEEAGDRFNDGNTDDYLWGYVPNITTTLFERK